ncbi:hypothetical protein PR048_016171 [Dryococelus australis]|uniref:Uncharacterized protein n=1 Tax=Dryococelus australis TaxID=614101 RepID=A0ABQ9HJ01_9NEOP|nr:hypothetical protein PR048_016171 [Dryococelus australis]
MPCWEFEPTICCFENRIVAKLQLGRWFIRSMGASTHTSTKAYTNVDVEQRRNARARETRDPRENPLTNDIVRHDSHVRKQRVNPQGIKLGSPWLEASALPAVPPRLLSASRVERRQRRTKTGAGVGRGRVVGAWGFLSQPAARRNPEKQYSSKCIACSVLFLCNVILVNSPEPPLPQEGLRGRGVPSNQPASFERRSYLERRKETRSRGRVYAFAPARPSPRALQHLPLPPPHRFLRCMKLPVPSTSPLRENPSTVKQRYLHLPHVRTRVYRSQDLVRGSEICWLPAVHAQTSGFTLRLGGCGAEATHSTPSVETCPRDLLGSIIYQHQQHYPNLAAESSLLISAGRLVCVHAPALCKSPRTLSELKLMSLQACFIKFLYCMFMASRSVCKRVKCRRHSLGSGGEPGRSVAQVRKLGAKGGVRVYYVAARTSVASMVIICQRNLAGSFKGMLNFEHTYIWNRAGRCHWSAGFLGDLPFLPPFHSGAAPYSPRSLSSDLKTMILAITDLIRTAQSKVVNAASQFSVFHVGAMWRWARGLGDAHITPSRACASELARQLQVHTGTVNGRSGLKIREREAEAKAAGSCIVVGLGNWPGSTPASSLAQVGFNPVRVAEPQAAPPHPPPQQCQETGDPSSSCSGQPSGPGISFVPPFRDSLLPLGFGPAIPFWTGVGEAHQYQELGGRASFHLLPPRATRSVNPFHSRGRVVVGPRERNETAPAITRDSGKLSLVPPPSPPHPPPSHTSITRKPELQISRRLTEPNRRLPRKLNSVPRTNYEIKLVCNQLHYESTDFGFNQSNVREDIWAALNIEVFRADEGDRYEYENEGTGETGDLRENPLTNGIVRHDYKMRKSRAQFEEAKRNVYGDTRVDFAHTCFYPSRSAARHRRNTRKCRSRQDTIEKPRGRRSKP